MVVAEVCDAIALVDAEAREPQRRRLDPTPERRIGDVLARKWIATWLGRSPPSARRCGRGSRLDYHSQTIKRSWMHASTPPPRNATASRSSRCCGACCRRAARCSRSRAAPASTRSGFAEQLPGLAVPAQRSRPGPSREHRRVDRRRASPTCARRSRSSRRYRTGRRTPTSRRISPPMLCINMIHIAPWEAALGLVRGAARAARAGRRALSLRPLQARRRAHRAEQRGVRSSLRAQRPGLGRARSRGGRTRPPRRRASRSRRSFEMPANNLSAVLKRG